MFALTQSLADAMAGTGIRIYAVLPGAVNTQLNWDLDLGMDPRNYWLLNLLPKRYLGLPKVRGGPASRCRSTPKREAFLTLSFSWVDLLDDTW